MVKPETMQELADKAIAMGVRTLKQRDELLVAAEAMLTAPRQHLSPEVWQQLEDAVARARKLK